MEYERKGSGAIIHVHVKDEVQHIKASQAHRAASLGALVKRFGEYEPAQAKDVKPREPEPVRPDAPRWAEYKQQKDQHRELGNVKQREIETAIATERKALRERQFAERKQVFSGDWRGHGRELNLLRSVLAAKQAAEQAELQDKVKRLRKQYKREQFPSYEQWLEQQGMAIEAQAWRYQSRENAAVGTEQTPAKPVDIRAMSHVIDGDVVKYQRDNDTKFIDYGKKVVFNKLDEDSVLAGLQLAQQKWQRGFVVTGNDAYLQQCARLAGTTSSI